MSINSTKPIVFIDDAHTFGGAQTGLAWAVRAILYNTGYPVVCVCPARTKEAILRIAGKHKQLTFVECPKALPVNIVAFPLRLLRFSQIIWQLRKQGVKAWWLSLSGIEFCLAPLLVLKALGESHQSWLHCTETLSALTLGVSPAKRLLLRARDYFANRFLFRHHPVLVTPSATASNTIRKRIGTHTRLHHLHYCPIVTDADRLIVQAAPEQDRRPCIRLWMIGRISIGHKNNLAAIEAFRVLKSRGHTVSLQIRGDGPDMAKLKSNCKDLTPADGLTFSGWSADPWQGVTSDDVVLIPSFDETLCLVAVEAMLRGVRMVLSPLPVFRDLYPGQFIANGFSGEPFADQVEKVAALDRVELSHLYSHALKKFSEEHFLQSFAALSNGMVNVDGFAESFA